MNIMISINDKFLNIAKVMLFSLFSNNSGEMDVYLICHNLSENTIRELKKVFELFEGKRLWVMELGNIAENDIPLYVAYSPEILYKMLGISILPDNLHKILWLDADMIVKGDLSELYATDIVNAPMAVCEDINAVINDEDEAFKIRCGMPSDSKYFNAGMCLFNLDYMRSHNVVGVFRNVINQRHEEYSFLEQDALNSLFFDDAVLVPWSLYNVHPCYFVLSADDLSDGIIRFASYKEINEQSQREDYLSRYIDITKYIKEQSKIIHYIGLSKPWREDSADMYWTQAAFKDIWLDYEQRLEECLKEENCEQDRTEYAVSVIIPCFNAEKYIDRCWQSLKQQTIGIEKMQIIFVDDVSTDGTVERVNGYAKEYPASVTFIKLKEKALAGGARNEGLKIAKGTYVTFLDADDYLAEDALESMCDALKKHRCDMVQAEIKLTISDNDIGSGTGDGVLWDLTDDIERKKYILNHISVDSCGKMFTRSFLEENRLSFIPGLYRENIYFMGLLLFTLDKVFYLKKKLYFYRQNDESTVHMRYDSVKEKHYSIQMNMLDDELKHRGMYDMIRQRFWCEYQYYFVCKGLYDPMYRLLNAFDSQKKLYIDMIKSHFPDISTNIYINTPVNRQSEIAKKYLEDNTSIWADLV